MTKERAQEQKGGLEWLKWPEWRLYANFLHRELARLWYGKKSIFPTVKDGHKDANFWRVFDFIFIATVQRFGLAHGLKIDEMTKRFEGFCKEWEGRGERLTSFHVVYWLTRQVLGDKLASEFLFDMQITDIVSLAVCAFVYATDGRMPLYEKNENIRPIGFYEGLPVAPELEAQFYGKNLA